MLLWGLFTVHLHQPAMISSSVVSTTSGVGYIPTLLLEYPNTTARENRAHRRLPAFHHSATVPSSFRQIGGFQSCPVCAASLTFSSLTSIPRPGLRGRSMKP